MITARVEGMAKLSLTLKALQASTKAALEKASLEGAEVISEEAGHLAPRRAYETSVGHLADHIITEVAKSTPSTCLVRIGPDEDHWYGRFSETGTVKMAARPFLRPALDTKQREAVEKFGESMRTSIKALKALV